MITSTANKQVKRVASLLKKAKLRREEDLFLVEGVKMFAEAEASRIRRIYVSESFYGQQEHRRLVQTKMAEGHLAEDVRIEVADHVFEAMSDTKTPQGILCEMECYHYTMEDLMRTSSPPRILVLENLQDPGNLGTMMRAGEGAGISGVILTDTSVDMYNPKTIRSTMGSIYRVPFFYAASITDVIAELQARCIPVYAAALQESVAYDQPDYTKGCAFLIGNEGNGLTAEAIEAADQAIRIPMEGKLESLNAGVAAAILMYESYRQSR